MTRTAQGSLVFTGNLITSGGVLPSFPGQNGQESTNDGTTCAGRCVANSSGRLARSVAMMTHSLVKKFCRNWGIGESSSFVYRQEAHGAQVRKSRQFARARAKVTLVSAIWEFVPGKTLIG